MKKSLFIFLLPLMSHAQIVGTLSQKSDSTLSHYIFANPYHVNDELTLNGFEENPAVTQSKQLLNLPKPCSPTEQMKQQNMAAMNSPKQPTEDQINKGTYYEEIAKERRAVQDEIYSEINNNGESNTSALSKPVNKTPRFLCLADTNEIVKSATHLYGTAYEEICRMLNGQDSLNLKRAVFLVENCYYGNKLEYNRYLKQIDSLVSICKLFLKVHGFSIDNKLACNYAIQSLYSDTMQFGKRIVYPITYDYVDFMGDNDYSKQFVAKLLNSGTGQCHSMPLLYLIIANEMHTDAFLVLAPAHSYIKYPMGNSLCAFECTCGRQSNDKFMTGSGYISSEAILNKIYLAPQTPLQTIAQCLSDLATQYAVTYGYNDFVYNCCTTVLHYNPQCISALQNIANAGTAICAHYAALYNYPKQTDYEKYPELKKRFDNMVALQTEIDRTGYVQIPKEQYAQWLESANNEEQKKLQAQLKNKLHSYLETKPQ